MHKHVVSLAQLSCIPGESALSASQEEKQQVEKNELQCRREQTNVSIASEFFPPKISMLVLERSGNFLYCGPSLTRTNLVISFLVSISSDSGHNQIVMILRTGFLCFQRDNWSTSWIYLLKCRFFCVDGFRRRIISEQAFPAWHSFKLSTAVIGEKCFRRNDLDEIFQFA